MDIKQNHIMAVAKFKAHCLKEIELVKQTGEPLVVTKRGEPIVVIVPYVEPNKNKKHYGCMQETINIKGDIIAPIEEEWSAEQDEE